MTVRRAQTDLGETGSSAARAERFERPATNPRPLPRGAATKRDLMREAERLIAEHGIRNVTIRQIVRAAGQRNESALQYHFGSLQGLIDTLRTERSAEVQARRSDLLEALLVEHPEPSLRILCEVMARPAFDLARSRPEFRRYVMAFSQEVIFAESYQLAVERLTGATGRQLGRLLRARLPHLDEAAYRRRMDAAVRLAAVSASHYARQMDAFKEQEADLYFHSLVDALVGLLEAPVSETTRRLARALGDPGVEEAPAALSGEGQAPDAGRPRAPRLRAPADQTVHDAS